MSNSTPRTTRNVLRTICDKASSRELILVMSSIVHQADRSPDSLRGAALHLGSRRATEASELPGGVLVSAACMHQPPASESTAGSAASSRRGMTLRFQRLPAPPSRSSLAVLYHLQLNA